MPLGDQTPKLNLNKNSSRNPLVTVLTVVASVALLAAGFVFSLLIVAIIAVIGLAASAYLWWKTRSLRRHLSEQMQREQQHSLAQDEPLTEGVIIEGEVIRDTTPPRQ